MPNSKKLLQAAAGAAGGAGLDIPEVFSTYVYDGTGSAQTITNGIDLSGEGGLVWTKKRSGSSATSHVLHDSARGVTKGLITDTTGAEIDYTVSGVTSFNSSGYVLGTGNAWNNSDSTYVSWTWRKAPKFFDVIKYQGTTADKTINHNLGTTVGAIFIKSLDSSRYWWCTHRGLNGGTNWWQYDIHLNDTLAEGTEAFYAFMSEPSSTSFTLRGGKSEVNANGENYVAYVFAHNDGDGDFGPTGDQDIIKCGSYTGNGSTDGTEIDLGFEPQWLLIKDTTSTGSWYLLDVMRGIVTDGTESELYANQSNAEATVRELINLTPTGFKLKISNIINTNNNYYIYMAIRRGPLAEPESATDVFGLDFTTFGSDGPVFGFANDMFLGKALGNATKWYLSNRLTGNNYLSTDSTAAELSTSSVGGWDRMDGNGTSATQNILDIAYGWKRAPKFFDIVMYTGDGTNSRQISHNLGATPQWVLLRSSSDTSSWLNWFAPLGDDHYMTMTTSDKQSSAVFFNTADSTSFTLGTSNSFNVNTRQYIAWLFGSLDGISKVGTYTGNGSSQTIDCGFSTSARWIMIKRYDATGDWHVWDTEKGSNGGIVAGTEAFLELNTTNGISSYQDTIDPDSSGFTVHETTNSSVNASGASYIFYALA